MYPDALDHLKRAREKRTDLANEFWRDRISGASHCATSSSTVNWAAWSGLTTIPPSVR